MQRLNQLFESEVEIPRIRHAKRQTLDTLINEEALLLAKYLRNEKKEWKPRILKVKPFMTNLKIYYLSGGIKNEFKF